MLTPLSQDVPQLAGDAVDVRVGVLGKHAAQRFEVEQQHARFHRCQGQGPVQTSRVADVGCGLVNTDFHQLTRQIAWKSATGQLVQLVLNLRDGQTKLSGCLHKGSVGIGAEPTQHVEALQELGTGARKLRTTVRVIVRHGAPPSS